MQPLQAESVPFQIWRHEVLGHDFAVVNGEEIDWAV
jgi:hypothetical protein